MADDNDRQTQIGGGQDIGDDDQAKIGQGQDIDGRQTPSDTGAVDPKLKEFMVKKGLKTIDDVINFANEKERKVTDLSTKSQLSGFQMPPPPNFQRQEPAQIDLELPENTADLIDDRDKLKSYSLTLIEKAKQAAKQEMKNERDIEEATRIYYETERLVKKDPEKFNRLRGIMKDLYQQYPHASPQELYDEADRLYESNRKAALDEIRREMGLEGISAADLQNLLRRKNQAPISDTSGSVGGGGSPSFIKAPGQMTADEKKTLIMDSIFGETASVLRDDES